MRRILSLVAVLLLCLTQVECTPANAENPRDVRLKLIATQAYDSLGIIVNWTLGEPPNSRQLPIEGHNVTVIEVDGAELGSSYVLLPAQVDTFWVPMPALGDTLTFYGAVNAQDTQGNVSGWVTSTPFTWVSTPLAPNTPGGVTVDTTIGALVIDSLRLLDDQLTVAVADTGRLAAVLYSGIWPVECCCTELTDPPGTHPCDDVTLVTLSSVMPIPQPTFKYIKASTFTGDARIPLPEQGVLRCRDFVNAWRGLAG